MYLWINYVKAEEIPVTQREGEKERKKENLGLFQNEKKGQTELEKGRRTFGMGSCSHED